MIDKSIYDDYSIGFSIDCETSTEGYFFIFNNERNLYLVNNIVPKCIKDIDFEFNFKLYIGEYKGESVFVLNTDTVSEDFYSLPFVYSENSDLYLISCRAVLVNDWYKSHRFCGACGSETVVDDKDMMLKCPNCGQVHYTRIAPAVIVAIRNDDKLLMAKHSYHSDKYSLIAGFVEAGETVEDAVCREVLEEVGLHIKNLRYVKSQSWPYPNSLMLAFEAEYDYGSISVDGDEIVDAKWFSKSEISRVENEISVFSFLVNKFLDE